MSRTFIIDWQLLAELDEAPSDEDALKADEDSYRGLDDDDGGHD